MFSSSVADYIKVVFQDSTCVYDVKTRTRSTTNAMKNVIYIYALCEINEGEKKKSFKIIQSAKEYTQYNYICYLVDIMRIYIHSRCSSTYAMHTMHDTNHCVSSLCISSYI